jgi:hypothetical protein
MKFLIKLLIAVLKLLQKLPYETIIQKLNSRLLTREKPVLPKNLPKIQISFQHGTMFLDDVEIIGAESQNLHKIFRIFLDQFIHDAIDGRIHTDFKLLNMHEIAELLEKAGLTILDPEKQVRRQINRLQKITHDKFNLPIIESVRWTGVGAKSFGYRLSKIDMSWSRKRQFLLLKNCQCLNKFSTCPKLTLKMLKIQ